ncbi:MAG TPA: hypothetical protein VMW70_08170 [Burkholderiales bacterium]|nr:hypothetical protein [Burkholderiales bacterium]
MKLLISLLCVLVFMSNVYAWSESDGANAPALPEEATAQVKELDVKVRYFKAIGFHTQSKEARDEIAAIYETHGVPLPDEYKE